MPEIVRDLSWPEAPCCAEPSSCVCPQEERALRAWSTEKPMPPMTDNQREWCLREIDQVEGFRRREHECDSDQDLARTVLDAWLDYCWDKGLIE